MERKRVSVAEKQPTECQIQSVISSNIYNTYFHSFILHVAAENDLKNRRQDLYVYYL